MSTRYNTGNPIESTDVRDMSDNAKNLDLFSNSSDMAFDDRFGVERKTIHGMNSEFNSHILNVGFSRIGTFASGATLTNTRQTLLWDIADGGDGQEYGWSGTFAPHGKIVPPSSSPTSTGGIAIGAWVSRFDPLAKTQIREALRRSYAEAGYNLIGDFSNTGLVVNSVTDVVLWEPTGVACVYSGTLPHTIGAGETPIGNPLWVARSGESLRGELAEPDGASRIGIGGGRTQADRNSEIVSVLGHGADRTGAVDSTVAFLDAGYWAFVPEGLYLVDPAQVNIKHYWGPGKLRYTTDLSEHWCGLASRGTLYIRNDDTNPNTTPTVPSDGLINLADGELKLLCDLDGDGDYDADIYGKNNLYIAGENSIHFRIDPQGPAEGRIRLASTTNTNFIQSGKDFSGATLKNLAFGPYLSTNYWAFFSQSSGYCALGNSASPAAPLHVYNQQTTAALAENTSSSRARMGFKGSTTTSGTTVTFGADGNDAEVRAGGTERLVITADGFVRPATANAQFCGSNRFPWAGGFTQTAFTVTSDEECKTELVVIDDKILDAWADVGLFAYKFKDRVEIKGDGARWHFGTGARRVVEVFKAHGLDATDYAFLCYDRWDDVIASVQTNEGETVTVEREISRPVMKKIKSFVDERVAREDGTVIFVRKEIEKEVPVTVVVPVLYADGSPVVGSDGEAVMSRINLMENVFVSSVEPAEPVFEDVVVTPAGERYGIRYEEALILEAALLRREIQRLKKPTSSA